MQSSIKYLGFFITKEGIKADNRDAIRNFPVPEKLKNVQRFLRLCSCLRRFIKDFFILAKPLYEMIWKDKEFSLRRELNCFLNLKKKLTESPVLAIYGQNDDIELHCDASSLGFGAVLIQKKGDGKFHPVFYFSKRTTDTEVKYRSFELETLAVIYVFRRFQIYLQGKHLKVITDCNSLTLTLNRVELNPRIALWAVKLQNYDYKVDHRSGKMQHVDAKSRCHVLIVEANSFEDSLLICQSKDPNIQQIRDKLGKNQLKMFKMRKGVVYRKMNDDRMIF